MFGYTGYIFDTCNAVQGQKHQNRLFVLNNIHFKNLANILPTNN